ncbi:MAG: glycoside hydrolase family 2 TIM barrel-domain containing protein [Chloroflexota bacterium]
MTRKIISLNDSNWRLGSVAQKRFSDVNDLADVTEWLPAKVPGDVRLDLLRAGKIADLFFADNNEKSQWVDSRDWWYVHDLDLDLEDDERAFLIFDGIDYQSAVFWNGEQLARHAGMFSRQIIALPTADRRPPTNSPISNLQSPISIRIWGSAALPKLKRTLAQQLWARLVKPLYTPPSEPFPDRYATLKCQMQFGWDFAPRLRTCGIWDDAYIAVARSVFVEDVWVKCKITNDKLANDKPTTARVQVILLLDSDRAQNARVVCNVRGKNFADDARSYTFNLDLARGTQVREVEFVLPDARLWNPWDRGEPNLYEMDIVIARSEATKQSPIRDLGIASQTALAMTNDVLDSATTTFGIRDFSLARAPHAPITAEPWQFVINGQREFLRGANWVPLDAIPARLTRADYAVRLQQVRDANINFLRVWGGGLREKRAFYDLCDEMGILVWQEFPFAGTLLDHLAHDRAFLKFVRAECGDIVRALRNHPSLVVWCGGNEFSPRGNQPLVKKLRGVVKDKDGTRPFKPASPYRDESHNWRVWHRFANLRDYRDDATPFLSEFGLQSLPNFESLRKFLPADALTAPHSLWVYHCGELKKLGRYARSVIASGVKQSPISNLQSPPSNSALTTEAFIDATQRAQASGLQIAIEHVRRRKPQTTGVAVWQFNDPWPAISWSVVDYYGTPKRAYDELKKMYSPVLASFGYELLPRRAGDPVRGDLWIVNDLRVAYPNAALRADLNGAEIFERALDIEPDSAARVDALALTLGDGENILRLQVIWQDKILSDHEYDLNFCDDGEIGLLGRLIATIARRLMR